MDCWLMCDSNKTYMPLNTVLRGARWHFNDSYIFFMVICGRFTFQSIRNVTKVQCNMCNVRYEIFRRKPNQGQMRAICLDLYSLGNNCPSSALDEHLFSTADTTGARCSSAFPDWYVYVLCFSSSTTGSSFKLYYKASGSHWPEWSACLKYFLQSLVREENNGTPVLSGTSNGIGCLQVVVPARHRIFDSLTFLNSFHWVTFESSNSELI